MTASSRRFWSAMNLGGLSLRQAAVRTWTRLNEHAILTRAAAISFLRDRGPCAVHGALDRAHGPLASLDPATHRGRAGVRLLDAFGELLPGDAAEFISHELARLRTQPRTGLISFGLVAVMWLSSSVFVEIIDAMNYILGVRESRSFWKRRAIAMVMTLSQAAILVAAVLTIMAWPQIVNFLHLSLAGVILATATIN